MSEIGIMVSITLFLKVMDKLEALFTIRIRNKLKHSVLEDCELNK